MVTYSIVIDIIRLNPYSTGSWVAGSSGFNQLINGRVSLNPYSTGSWVAGIILQHRRVCGKQCLNPYSTGSWVAGTFNLSEKAYYKLS